MRNDRRERIGNDLSEYQKWVDYDMKKYGKISDITKGKIGKAGLSIVKDQYGDYEVIADRPIKEGLKEGSPYGRLGDPEFTTVEFGNGMRITARSEEEAIRAFRPQYGEMGTPKVVKDAPARSAKELDKIAMSIYKSQEDIDDDRWYDFTDEELAILWSMCALTKENPWGRAYDDEVYDAINSIPYGSKIFQRAEDILDGKVNESCHPRKLKEAKTKEIIVLQGNYGYGWDDLCSYESNQWGEAKGDFNDYRENERDAIHRLIRRRVPTDGVNVKEGCGKLNEKSDYNALRKAKEFIKNATTRVGFYDKIRAILKDSFIEDWDIKQLQRLADAKYEQLGEVNESYRRRIREGSSYTVGDKMFKLNGINLKDWYTSEYPDDELGYELNDDVDLRRCYSSLGRDPDIYDVMGVGDSVIRERVFAKMADVLGVDYDVIYYKWLGH